MTGTGDIAPIAEGHGGPADSAATVTDYLLGTFAGLIALAVVAAMFMTAEYRRNLIRVTLAASPRRGRVLAAKAIVVGRGVLRRRAGGRGRGGRGRQRDNPRPRLLRVPRAGVDRGARDHRHGLLAALTAVLALAVGTIVRRSAAAVAIVIVALVLPYFLAVAAVVPLGAADWLLRITPAAGFAAQQAYPRVPAGQRHLFGPVGLFPARLVGRPGGAVRLGRRRPWPRAAVLLRRRGTPDGRTRCSAEWTKLRTLSSTWWLLLAVVALTIVVGAAVAAGGHCAPGACAPGQTGADPAKISLSGVYLGQVIVALLAVLAAGGEYGTGMIRVTLAATPRRLVMLAAKAAVVTGWAVAAGTAAVLGSVLAGRLILPGRGLSAANGYVLVSLGNGPDLRAAAGSVVYLALIALLALGITMAVRDSAVGIGLVLRRAVPVPDHQLA